MAKGERRAYVVAERGSASLAAPAFTTGGITYIAFVDNAERVAGSVPTIVDFLKQQGVSHTRLRFNEFPPGYRPRQQEGNVPVPPEMESYIRQALGGTPVQAVHRDDAVL